MKNIVEIKNLITKNFPSTKSNVNLTISFSKISLAIVPK